MSNFNFLEKIKQSIKAGDEIAPVLFVWNDLWKVHFEINEIITELFSEFNVDKNSIYSLNDDWSNIKIEEIKNLLSKSFIWTSFKFQIFYIENISRLTIKASNALLKFLEEPWKWNIVFLSNLWENNILDTIISRVQIINIDSVNKNIKNLVYYELINDYLLKDDIRIFSYFYNEKLENNDYKNFLINLLYFIKENKSSLSYDIINLIDEITESINLIESNNLLWKYQVDRILLKIK